MLFRAGWVVPVDRPPLRDAAVAVENGQVRWVGPTQDAPAGEAHDLGAGVLLPGLVNAHCHLELSHLAGRLAGASGFVDWVERLVTMRPEDSMDTVRQRAAAGIRELEATGTVAVGDVSNALAHLDLLEDSSLRARVFFELIGWDPAAAERVLGAAHARLGSLNLSDTVTVSLAAHAPHSVSPALLRAIVEAGGVSALHLAESPHERRFLHGRDGEWSAFLTRRGLGHVAFVPPHLSPVGYLDRLGVLQPGLVAAHGSRWTRPTARCSPRVGSPSSCARAATARSTSASPPSRSCAPPECGWPSGRTAWPACPASTSGRTSWPSIAPSPSLEAEWLVRTATQGGAEALGMHDLGRIARGAEAAFAFAEGPRSMPDPLAFLLSGEARLRGVRA